MGLLAIEAAFREHFDSGIEKGNNISARHHRRRVIERFERRFDGKVLTAK